LSYASNASQSFAEKVADAAKKVGIPCETVLKTSVRPWQEIVATAKEKNCDCIVMASHGRKGYNALVLGSNANKVLTHSHIPVLVFRPALVPDISAAEGAQWDMMGF
jgi:nucleotide-binding universal stress UspA family protein